jgi:hypothetical protein
MLYKVAFWICLALFPDIPHTAPAADNVLSLSTEIVTAKQLALAPLLILISLIGLRFEVVSMHLAATASVVCWWPWPQSQNVFSTITVL